MSLKLATFAFLSALLVAGCLGQPQTASRTPDDTLQNGTPEGDHTGAQSGVPRNDVDDNAPPVAPEQVPGPGYTGTPDDPPAAPTGGASGPNGASPGGSAGPGH
jgi:hypothetical protein